MTNTERITFILPGPSKNPVGGYKIVYEYANRLANMGYEVTILHPAIIERDIGLLRYLRKYLTYIFRSINKSAFPNWFAIDNKVRLIWALTPAAANVPAANYVFATAWQTAAWVNDYESSKGKKFYLIQGMESWDSSEDMVFATWHYSMHKIVISHWLEQKLKALGEESLYLPNGLNFNDFYCNIPSSERNSQSVAFLFHESEHKGSKDCLEALRIVKYKYPSLIVKAFGVPKRPKFFPEWVEYFEQPSPAKLRKIYNSVAIYVTASHMEGWGLTGCEALQCGAALVATDIGGHREYAIDNITALLCDIANPQDLADKIEYLIDNTLLRCNIAENGRKFVRQFTWDRSVNKLTDFLNSPLDTLEKP